MCFLFFDRNGKKERLYNSTTQFLSLSDEKTVATIASHKVRMK